jgi:MFS family permease
VSGLGPLPRFLGLVFLAGALGGPVRGLLSVYVESTLRQAPAFSSLLLSLLLVGAGIFAVVGGALSDRLGPKRTFSLGVLWLLPAAGLFVASDPAVLLAAAAVAGVVDGLYVVGGQAYLVAATPRAHLGLGSALFFVGSTLGTSLGSLAAGTAAEQWGFGAFGAGLAVAAVGLAAAVALLLPSAAPAGPSAHRGVGLRGLALLARNPGLRLVATVRFLPTVYWGAATVLMPLLLYRRSGSVVGASLYLTVSLAVAAACQIAVGRLADRVGWRWPIAALTALLPLAALGTALAAGSYAGLFAAGVFATCVAWSLSVSFPPLVRELAAEGESGRALGVLHMLWVVAMIVGTNAGARLVEVDASLPFLIGAAINVPTALAGLALGRLLHPAVRSVKSEP